VKETPNNMNSRWKAFLESRSARIDEGGNVHFEDASAHAECALMDLSQLGLIAVSGPQAVDFLQGQLTSDVRELPAGRTQLSSHCSPKGRMLASFRLFKLDETVYLQLPRTKVESTLQRLRMYLLRTKAAMEDAGDRLAAIGIAGQCAPSLLASVAVEVPERDNGLVKNGDLIAIGVPGSVPRFEILGPPPALEPLWDELASKASIADADLWALLDIRAGIPSIYPETSDAFVPQMANMQLLDAVSFKKGCYTGQEVVARMQYLGKLKRRMYRANVRSERPPEPGDELYCAASSSGQATGRIVDARANSTGGYELLAVVEIESAEKENVRLGGPEGPLLSFSDPPYGFPSGT
jgi:folate-binding protein YgfZ